MSELAVGSLKGLAANSFVIDVASGSKIVQPGSILQVVSATKTDTFSTSSGSFVDVTGLNVSITPSLTTSKIMILAQVSAGAANADNNGGYSLRLSGGNAETFVGDAAGSRIRGVMGRLGNGGTPSYGPGNTNDLHTIVFLDSPASVAAVTYKVQFLSTSGTAYINRSGQDLDTADFNRGVSSITLMEVAG